MNTNSTSPFVSVIIPHYNDFDRLKICLSSLEKQTYPFNKYEVIVIDNGSTANFNAIKLLFPHFYFKKEIKRGSYAARNKGISLARGQIIAFTDSDCIPALDWIENGVKKINEVPNCGLVAGRIKLFYKNPSKLTMVELFEKHTAFSQERYVKDLHFGATANIFTFKIVINKVGKFNEKYFSGSDRKFGEKVYFQGYILAYTDKACVAHPARYSFLEMYKKQIRIFKSSERRHLNRKLDYQTGIKRFFINVIDLVNGTLPPYKKIKNIFSNNRYTFIEKVKISLVFYIINIFHSTERIKLLIHFYSGR